MNFRKIYCIAVMALMCCTGSMFTSCDDYLDVDSYFDEIFELDSVFKRKEYLEKYINGAGKLLPNEGDLWTNAWSPYQGASDENFTSWNDSRHKAIQLMVDEVTPQSDFYNNYGTWYKGIRKANLVLERINECEDITTSDLRDFMGRCYFLRAYFYYKLVEAYGPVPIVPETAYDVDASAESMSLERETYENCINYICENFEKAYEYLPSSRTSTLVNLPTSGAALALMGRVRLIEASPWYNGNEFYADWKRSDGTNFMPQVKDESKWGTAALLAKRLIKGSEAGSFKYKLHTVERKLDTKPLPENVPDENYPNGAGGIDALRSYAFMFNGETPAYNNDEFIYMCGYSSTGGDSPAWIATPTSLGGGNGLNITYATVKAFRMEDGSDINNSPLYPTNYWEAIGGSSQSFSDYTLPSDAAKMFDKMEMRFYASVGFNHCYWSGLSYIGTEGNQTKQTVTYYANGTAAPSSDHPEDYNHTGFTCKKYIHYVEDQLKGMMKSKTFPIMRYAEVLLNYVEALNELGSNTYTDEVNGITVSRDVDEMVKYFNMVRYRAGLPGITADDARDVTTMRDLIKRERRVEFFCEGRRYHDLRRWGDAIDAYNEPVTGMNIAARSTDRKAFHTETVINNTRSHRVFSYKDYFLPIPRTTMDKNPKLVQNPGW